MWTWTTTTTKKKESLLKWGAVCLCVQSMATTVAQLFMALPHSPAVWSLQHTGVACFVKDNLQRSYFIRMFDMKVTPMCPESKHKTAPGRVGPHIRRETLTTFLPVGRQDDLGAGAVQPNCLFLTAALLSHLCCRCKPTLKFCPPVLHSDAADVLVFFT